ncbi:MAG: hypothetical protein J3Q66DRAFT_332811 [Benniella sp.]|nr:MAG: hypothetical protein J3Q66DRAFT_332811 [Benniella sp.]
MTFSSGDQQLQAFRSPTNEVFYVEVKMDPNTRNPIILWADIQDKFRNVKFIKNGDTIVLFQTDVNFEEITPKRIAYHPGVELYVSDGSDQAAPAQSELHPYTGTFSTGTVGIDSSTGIVATRETTSSINDGQAIAKYSEGISNGNQSSLHAYFQTIMAGQEFHARSVTQFIDQRFGQLKDAMDKDRKLQELMIFLQKVMVDDQAMMQQLQEQTKEELLQQMIALYELQQNTEAQLLQTREELGKKQDEILELQTNAIDRLASIQNSVKSLVTQSYELHENPLPRLFVVLPMVARSYDRTASLRPDQFKLFFLCECGKHTTPRDSPTPHEIHLAKHEGYELDMPEEFFMKYGSCVLSMMYMVKYRINTDDLVVPTLEKLVHGVDGTRELQEYLKNNITPLVDDTIEFLKNLGNTNETRIEVATNRADVNTADVLPTGADLKHLDSYLKVKDRERTPGNLFKIFTLEGHIKWVCLDHYRCGHRESAFNKLREVLRFNRGIFIEEQGKVEVKVVSSNVATQFYDAMTEARKIQELDITLEWDVSMDDLRAFTKAVTRANVVSLTLNGSHFKGPTRDTHNRNRRFEPILQLACNGRIQSLQLDGFDDFFSRINNIPPVATSALRMFSLEWNGPYKDKSVKSFRDFLAICPNLTSLKLRCQQNNLIETVVQDTGESIPGVDVELIEYDDANTQDGSLPKGAKKGVVQRSRRFFKKMVKAKVTPGQTDAQSGNRGLSPLRSSKTIPKPSQSDNALAVLSPQVLTHNKTSKSHTDLYTSQGTGSEHSLATGNWSTDRRLSVSKNRGPIARKPSWSRLSEIPRGTEGSPYDEASGNAYGPHLLGLPQDRPTLQWRKISNAPMTRNACGGLC